MDRIQLFKPDSILFPIFSRYDLRNLVKRIPTMKSKIGLFAIVVFTASQCLFQSAEATKFSTKSGIEMKNLDKTVRPQDDLYRYVNNSWLKTTQIPADKSNYGTFTMLFDQSLERLKGIVEETASKK